MEHLSTALQHSNTSRFGGDRDHASQLNGAGRSRGSNSYGSEGSIVEAPRWLFLAALVYAPWAYGSTREWAVTGLNIFIGGVMMLWMVSCLLRHTWPQVPPVLAIATILLAAQGWFLVGNAKFDYDPTALEFNELSPLLPWAPGTLHINGIPRRRDRRQEIPLGDRSNLVPGRDSHHRVTCGGGIGGRAVSRLGAVGSPRNRSKPMERDHGRDGCRCSARDDSAGRVARRSGGTGRQRETLE